MNISPLASCLFALCLLQAGCIIGSTGLLTAQAEPPPPMATVPSVEELALFCKPFTGTLTGGSAAFETSDRTTEMGRWIAEHHARYQLHSVDFELVQKSTGFPTAYNLVCLRPR